MPAPLFCVDNNVKEEVAEGNLLEVTPECSSLDPDPSSLSTRLFAGREGNSERVADAGSAGSTATTSLASSRSDVQVKSRSHRRGRSRHKSLHNVDRYKLPAHIGQVILKTRKLPMKELYTRWFMLCDDNKPDAPPGTLGNLEDHDLFIHIHRSAAIRVLDNTSAVFSTLSIWIFDQSTGEWDKTNFGSRRWIGHQEYVLSIRHNFDLAWVRPGTIRKDERYRQMMDSEIHG
ncbi:hypothetical protein D9758_015348 [Tetrapyrgos nigripes]|uniref:Uncharacterized protein n=1 Tax=Tetrapyrgos nigripes TaxID=182062 RepID=A0A8H5CMU5_9AGAR|nr:hypothetical protein D9758_015348 [Tetrapyrgos nigripes]